MTPRGPRREPAESLDRAPQLGTTEIAAMVRLEAAWRKFGGPPASDIFVEFGISTEELLPTTLLGTQAATRPTSPAGRNYTPMKVRWARVLPAVPVAAVVGVAAYDLAQRSTRCCATFPSSDICATSWNRSARSCANTSSAATTRNDRSAATNADGSTHRRSCRTTTSASAPTATWSTRQGYPVVKHRTFAKIAPHAGASCQRDAVVPCAKDPWRPRRPPRHSGPNTVVNISGMSSAHCPAPPSRR